MPESLFLIFLPASVLFLMFGGMMFRDILSAHGVKGPDAFARRNRFFAWLLKVACVDQHPKTSSKWVMWWRLIGLLAAGVLFLSIGIIGAFGSR